jgi:hypothetical protein
LNLILSGIPYAFNTYHQFIAPVYAVFTWNDRGLKIPVGAIREMIAVTLFRNGTR